MLRPGDVTFDGSLTLSSFYGDISMIADGQIIQANGATNLYTTPANFPPNGDFNSEDRVGGDITVQALNDGTVATENLVMDASPMARTMRVPATAWAAMAGAATSTSTRTAAAQSWLAA